MDTDGGTAGLSQSVVVDRVNQPADTIDLTAFVGWWFPTRWALILLGIVAGWLFGIVHAATFSPVYSASATVFATDDRGLLGSVIERAKIEAVVPPAPPAITMFAHGNLIAGGLIEVTRAADSREVALGMVEAELEAADTQSKALRNQVKPLIDMLRSRGIRLTEFDNASPITVVTSPHISEVSEPLDKGWFALLGGLLVWIGGTLWVMARR